MIFDKVPELFFYKSEYENEFFVNNNYLILYKNKKVYYLQKIDNNIDFEEIKEYLEKNLYIDNSALTLNDKIKLNTNSSHDFIKPIKSNLFKYFVIYLFLLCFGFYFFDFNNSEKNTELKNIQYRTSVLKNEMNFEFLSKLIMNLYVNAKESDLKITSLSFKNSKVLLNLESIDKENIYKFLEELSSSNIENISFNEDIKRFIAHASFRISRK